MPDLLPMMDVGEWKPAVESLEKTPPPISKEVKVEKPKGVGSYVSPTPSLKAMESGGMAKVIGKKAAIASGKAVIKTIYKSASKGTPLPRAAGLAFAGAAGGAIGSAPGSMAAGELAEKAGLKKDGVAHTAVTTGASTVMGEAGTAALIAETAPVAGGTVPLATAGSAFAGGFLGAVGTGFAGLAGVVMGSDLDRRFRISDGVSEKATGHESVALPEEYKLKKSESEFKERSLAEGKTPMIAEAELEISKAIGRYEKAKPTVEYLKEKGIKTDALADVKATVDKVKTKLLDAGVPEKEVKSLISSTLFKGLFIEGGFKVADWRLEPDK